MHGVSVVFTVEEDDTTGVVFTVEEDDTTGIVDDVTGGVEVTPVAKTVVDVAGLDVSGTTVVFVEETIGVVVLVLTVDVDVFTAGVVVDVFTTGVVVVVALVVVFGGT